MTRPALALVPVEPDSARPPLDPETLDWLSQMLWSDAKHWELRGKDGTDPNSQEDGE